MTPLRTVTALGHYIEWSAALNGIETDRHARNNEQNVPEFLSIKSSAPSAHGSDS